MNMLDPGTIEQVAAANTWRLDPKFRDPDRVGAIGTCETVVPP